MYKFIKDVELLINEMVVTYEIKGRSLTFYKSRINKYFLDYMDSLANENRPLNAITYYDIDTFIKGLKCSDAEKVNYYSALKRFFDYTYLTNHTNEIISQVTKPIYERKPKEVLNHNEYLKLKEYIVSRKNNLYERLILGLFLFTGLSRQYIASLRNNQLVYEDGVYILVLWKNEREVKLPLKSELQLIIHEYNSTISYENKLDKVIKMEDNSISTYIGNLTNIIIRKRCTPTILSNTFISKALSSGNYIFEISKLTLESVSTIEQHITVNISNLNNRQTSILNSF
jgi:hypothetical protein